MRSSRTISLGLALLAFGPTPLATAGDLAGCRKEVERLRAESAAAELQRRERLPPDQLFKLGTANPTAADALGPVVERILKGKSAAAPAHTLECRTWACRLLVALASKEQAASKEWQSALQRDDELRERTAGMGFQGGRPTKDPLSGTPLFEREIYLHLADPSGKRVPQPRSRPAPVPSTAPLPATAAACAEEAKALRLRLETARGEAEAHRSPMERFQTGAPAPKLTAELRARLLEKFPGPETASLELECRATICRARWDKGPPNWHNLYDESWFRSMIEGMMVTSSPSSPGPEIYFVLTGEKRADALGFLQDLVKRFEASRAPADCEVRFPARGKLSMKLQLPKTGEPNEQGQVGKAGASYGDELAGTPLGKCMETAIAESILVAPLPKLPVGGAVLHHRFTFPRKPAAPKP